MLRWVRRTITIAVSLALIAAVARWWSARSVPRPASAPQWPPIDPVVATGTPPTSATSAPAAGAAPETPVRSSWVTPVDGQCTVEHPVKANDNSGIYHVPGGRFYDRTRAERCYVDAATAEADGYRAAKA